MFFITLAKMRSAIDEEFSRRTDQFMASPPAGITIHHVFHTLGQYDVVILFEAPTEKEALMAGMGFGDKAQTETMVAVPLEEAKALLPRKS